MYFLSPRTIALIIVLLFSSSHPLFAADDVDADDVSDKNVVVDSDVLQSQQRRAEVMKQASAATIAIFGLDGGGGGSGVIITPDGYALTNYHVSSACGDHMRCGLDNGKVYDAVIVGIDATGDVSLIKLLGRDDFPTAPLADSEKVRVGQWCFSAGNPFVLATNLQPSISFGIVSGVHRYQYPANTILEYADCIQTDAAVNPGNSGGPLFNLAGEVIGINGRCSFEKRSRINVGVGYAISSNQIKYFLGMLRSGRLVDHATLGATVSTDDTGKVLVSNILTNSDAYRRGLRYGDEILRLADREVTTTNTFKNILGTLPKAWRVPVVIRREGEQRTLLIRLAGVHTEQELIDNVKVETPPEKQPLPDPKDTPKTAPADEASGKATPEEAEPPVAPEQPDKAAVAKLLEQQTGFANYHFNRLERQQAWDRVKDAVGDYTAASSNWTVTGQLVGESTVAEVSLSSEKGLFKLGSRSLETLFDSSVADVVNSRRESGLTVALRAYQDLMLKGPEKIGDTVFLGKLPVYESISSTALANQPLYDTLRTQWYDAEVRFSIHPDTGLPSLIEVFGDAGEDPVEVYLNNFKPVSINTNGDTATVKFPHAIRLQYGTEPSFVIAVTQVQLSDPAGNSNSGEKNSGEGQ